MGTQARTVVPVILSGGNGTRLWPMSRELYPKQLLALLGERSMLQETARRVAGGGFAPPLLVCGDPHRFIVAEQLRALGITPQAILLEPVARGTAPAVAAAAMMVAREDPDALMLVCPADHVITDQPAFEAAVRTAASVAELGYLLTFGVPATSPETGYGYIRPAGQVGADPTVGHVGEFVEKPDARHAARMVAEQAWCWNSGMFLLPPRVFLDELRRLCPEIESNVKDAVDAAHTDLDFVRLGASQFERCPSISIDNAVMERTDKAAVVRARLGWDDVGSWSSLWRMGERDTSGNVLVGDVVDSGSNDCYLRADGVMVATLGLTDTIVVATSDVVLVADKTRDQQVKQLVERLKDWGRPEALGHPVVYRPWGSYEAIDAGPGYQVKHISVKPGHRLSLQTHSKRAEHWVVISGTADVVRGEDTLTLQERMSIDVPVGCVHRLSNPGPGPLHLIEVQTGSYLGEDDIVRLDDVYGRNVPAESA